MKLLPLLLCLCFASGCVSAEHMEKLNQYSKELKGIKADTDKTLKDMKSGDIEIAEGMAAIIENASKTAAIITAVNDIKQQGDYTIWEILGGLAIAVLGIKFRHKIPGLSPTGYVKK